MSAVPLMPREHLDELDRLAGAYWWHVHRAETVASLIDRFSPGRSLSSYLDIGCGPGATTRQIAGRLQARDKLDKASNITGIDFDASLIEQCRGHGVELRISDLAAGSVPPLERRFELFTALDVLEHLNDPSRLLAALRPHLTENALGVVTVPAYECLFSDWDRAAGHARRYNAGSLRTLLENARFTIVWQSYLYCFALPPAFLCRRIFKREQAETKLEFPKVLAWLNSALSAAGAAERLWLKAAPLPFGTSVLAVVRPA